VDEAVDRKKRRAEEDTMMSRFEVPCSMERAAGGSGEAADIPPATEMASHVSGGVERITEDSSCVGVAADVGGSPPAAGMIGQGVQRSIPPRGCKEALRADADMVPLNSSGLAVHQLHMHQTFSDNKNMVRKFEVGKESGKEKKVIMVLGATGAGKSTTLNGLVNYMVGVQWDDNFRFRLISELDTDHNQAQSQTSWVTAYVVHWRPGFKVDYTLIIIDTPGYGDTRGIHRDRMITDQIRQFFGSGTSAGVVDQIDAIGFVAQASLARLTPTQQFIFDSILALFGKDIEENIAVLATFADASEPPVKAALKEGNVPYCKLLKFNNSALFAANKGSTDIVSDDSGDETEAANEKFNAMFWDMGASSFKTFFKTLAKMPSKNLEMTKKVLSEREQIQARVEAIGVNVQKGLGMCETIRQEIDVMKRHARDIETNKDFTYTVNQDRVEKESVPSGTYVTNCVRCNFTCHTSCAFGNDEDKKRCCAMDASGYCTVCTGRCRWDEHKNMPYRMVVKTETVTKTSGELKSKYESAKKKKLSHTELINAQVEDFENVQLQVLRDTDEIRKGLRRLSEIALRDDPLSHVDYIDTLIQSEQQSCKPGWELRMKQLQEIRKQAAHMQKIADEGYDPFSNYKLPNKTSPQSSTLDTTTKKTLLSGLRNNVMQFLHLE